MANYSRAKIKGLLETSHNGATAPVKGRAAEDLVCYLFDKVPGVKVMERNVIDYAGSEEVDIVCWNEQKTNGFDFLPRILFVECKSWSNPVGNEQVAYFHTKIKERALPVGFLFASKGITGGADPLRNANSTIATALGEGRQLIVLTAENVQTLGSTLDLVELMHVKLCQLAARRTSYP